MDVHEVAAVLTMISGLCPIGPKNIDAHLVRHWHDRRSRNGFPAASGREKRGPHRPMLVWDLIEVVTWLATYTPNPGGAPRGNANALRTGQHAGERALRELRRLNRLTGR